MADYFAQVFINSDKLFPYIRKEQLEALPFVPPTAEILEEFEDVLHRPNEMDAALREQRLNELALSAFGLEEDNNGEN
jgi:hypothetical protein